MLAALEPDAAIDVVAHRDTGFTPPADVASYDGIAWTGSNLTVHRDTPAVRQQLTFARAAFAAGVPSFGSCWAVHVAVTAAGDRCEANPRGREFGVARKIVLTPAGSAHPMYAGKAVAFDALVSHEDHVVAVGPTTTVLAGNDFSPVQAVEVEQDGGVFWAVQYHPEYALLDVAHLGVLRAPQLVRQGFFRDPADAEDFLRQLRELHADPARTDLVYRLGVDADVLDARLRTCEARNWLDRLVKPSVRR